VNRDVDGNAHLLQFGSFVITFELECKGYCDEYIQQYFAERESAKDTDVCNSTLLNENVRTSAS
jgi:hypothetical protein